MADGIFTRIEMQTDDVAALKRAMAKINIPDLSDHFELDAAERQALFELSDALEDV
jgi:hypothetical protein